MVGRRQQTWPLAAAKAKIEKFHCIALWLDFPPGRRNLAEKIS
jgi:hypothetical protein